MCQLAKTLIHRTLTDLNSLVDCLTNQEGKLAPRCRGKIIQLITTLRKLFRKIPLRLGEADTRPLEGLNFAFIRKSTPQGVVLPFL